jgi:arsenate reductase-like glutaredoxin family protein
MLDAVAACRDVKQVKDWLQQKQIPFEEEFDSWA